MRKSVIAVSALDAGGGLGAREADVAQDLLARGLRGPVDPLRADRGDQLTQPVDQRRVRDLCDQVCRGGVHSEVRRLARPEPVGIPVALDRRHDRVADRRQAARSASLSTTAASSLGHGPGTLVRSASDPVHERTK